MKHVFFINPAAGKGKGLTELKPAIEQYFKDKLAEFKIIVTECVGDAREKARKIAETGEEANLYACGGDGTFFEVLNGAYGFKNVNLGAIPCGSGNDFLKFFSSREPFADIAAQVEGTPIDTDVIKVDDTYCVNICSLGMDAVVADGMSRFKRLPFVSGGMAYKLSIVKVLLGKIGQRARIKIDGEDKGEYDCLFAVCANGPVYGGGYKSAPNADPTDGRLEWLIVENISKPKILKFIKRYEQGTHEDLPICHHGHCRVMEIEALREEPINLDGEIIHRKKVRFELIPAGIKFILPKGITLKKKEKEFAKA
ncbi:MAG: diacylglycerol kinase family lipid kinase [Clostridia bacterium]|nr:diacylglycerol kinase family lipid kinase [Clostridia bacterium]